MLKLLVTETEPYVREHFVQIGAGYDIAVTFCPRNGVAAFSELASLRPDAAIVDVFMAGKDALTLIGQYRECYPDGKTVFYAVGKFNKPRLVDEVLASGFAAYYQKPFDFHVICRKLCGKRRSEVTYQYIRSFYRLAGLQPPNGGAMYCLVKTVDSMLLGSGTIDDALGRTAEQFHQSKEFVAGLLQNHCSDIARQLGIKTFYYESLVQSILDAVHYETDTMIL